MQKYAIKLGLSGSVLGLLAGLTESVIGSQILPWIGNKGQPVVLGLVTMLLSGMALGATISAYKLKSPSNDQKVAIFLGVFLPAVICFTTVGRLWYLPGLLLVTASLLIVYEYWLRRFPERQANNATVINPGSRIVAAVGSLLILVSVGLGFWFNSFGLFHFETLVNSQHIITDILPMDSILNTSFAESGTTVVNTEAGQVMIVYLLLIIGSALAFIAGLTSSRFFMGSGGLLVFAGLGTFLVFLPGIVGNIQQSYAPLNIISLILSLRWGWIISLFGASLILIACLFHSRHGQGRSG